MYDGTRGRGGNVRGIPPGRGGSKSHRVGEDIDRRRVRGCAGAAGRCAPAAGTAGTAGRTAGRTASRKGTRWRGLRGSGNETDSGEQRQGGERELHGEGYGRLEE